MRVFLGSGFKGCYDRGEFRIGCFKGVMNLERCFDKWEFKIGKSKKWILKECFDKWRFRIGYFKKWNWWIWKMLW